MCFTGNSLFHLEVAINTLNPLKTVEKFWCICDTQLRVTVAYMHLTPNITSVNHEDVVFNWQLSVSS